MGGAERLSYSIAVRALCEFTAKVGDLDLRFTRRRQRWKASSGTAPWHRGAAINTKAKWRWKASFCN
jgi:hypothetical protein